MWHNLWHKKTILFSGFLHILTSGFPGLFPDFKPNVHDQTEISV